MPIEETLFLVSQLGFGKSINSDIYTKIIINERNIKWH